MSQISRAAAIGCCTLTLLALLAVPPVSAAETSPAVSPRDGAKSQIGTPSPELKFGCHSSCLGSYTTAINGNQPSAWGMDPDCPTSTSHFQGDALNQADSICIDLGYDSACQVSFVVTTQCYTNPMGQIQIDGYANFKCFTVVCIEPPQQ